MSEILKVTIEGGVATLRMNRPAARNALSEALFNELAHTVPQLAQDDSVHVIVLTGTGEAFCAGGDITEMPADSTTLTYEQRVANLRRRARIVPLLADCCKLTIAKINGVAVGAGLALALACDFRIAAESAVFVTGFIRMALSGDCGAVHLLERLIGEARAKELFFLSDPLPAAEALRWGMLTRCVSDASLDAETAAFAARLAAGPRLAQSNMKDNFSNRGMSLSQAIDAESELLVRSAMAPDHAEAKRAFIARRAPRFGD